MLGCKGFKARMFFKTLLKCSVVEPCLFAYLLFPFGVFFSFYSTAETAQCIAFRTGAIFLHLKATKVATKKRQLKHKMKATMG